MNAAHFGVALGNIRSNPRMSKAQEQQAIAALHDFADHAGARIVIGNEIAYPRMRRIWRRVFTGWATAGARPGSENVVSVRTAAAARAVGRAKVMLGRRVVKWLSKGSDHVTPTRKTTELDVTIDGLRVRVIGTHLVSWWQAYAKPKAGKSWRLRHAIARLSIQRLRKRVRRAHAAGVQLVLEGGDVNALDNLHITDDQVVVLGAGPGAGGNLGKMMQLYAFPAPGVHVKVTDRKTHAPVATDHPFRAGSLEVSW